MAYAQPNPNLGFFALAVAGTAFGVYMVARKVWRGDPIVVQSARGPSSDAVPFAPDKGGPITGGLLTLPEMTCEKYWASEAAKAKFSKEHPGVSVNMSIPPPPGCAKPNPVYRPINSRAPTWGDATPPEIAAASDDITGSAPTGAEGITSPTIPGGPREALLARAGADQAVMVPKKEPFVELETFQKLFVASCTGVGALGWAKADNKAIKYGSAALALYAGSSFAMRLLPSGFFQGTGKLSYLPLVFVPLHIGSVSLWSLLTGHKISVFGRY